MRHRHLNHQRYTLAAIDDVIERGRMRDWLDLRDAARQRPELFDMIVRVCAPRLSNPYAQRYHFWNNYARSRRARQFNATRPD
ncbi:MAG: hypothetical protein J0I31_05705 [Rhizobiales bacterium]|uniref:hypothetical protein n=1 Tax=Xanthobacter flavus TaxID=281 RepID=UPI001AD41929|nr:hypothetical protein [Xanthobacter flavus]MBN8915076.1 hypothetical protein [Hyphomicrobiales bacterium]MBP2148434.1 hypothetical protein [Xanthobacter flavus]